jgi:hypothetical protein
MRCQFRTLILLAFLGIVESSAHAQCTLTQGQTLTAADGSGNDEFGAAVAVSSVLAVFGAPLHDETEIDSGAVYVFQNGSGIWQQSVELFPLVGARFDNFGTALAADSSRFVVGAPGDANNRGAVYFYSYGVLIQEQKLVASDGHFNDEFGSSVAIRGDLAAVGAPIAAPGGKAYVFCNSAGFWLEDQVLVPADTASGDYFGCAVAREGGVLVVGARKDSEPGGTTGSAYVYRLVGTTWTEEQKLLPPIGTGNARFGASVALAGDAILVGAPLASPSGSNSGAVYFFQWTGTAWEHQQQIEPSDAAQDKNFGCDISIHGNTAGIASNFGGSAYAFRFTGSQWAEQRRLVSTTGGVRLQGAIAVSGKTAMAGAFDDPINSNAGAAYSFDLADLALDVSPNIATAGDNITFASCGGVPGHLATLYVVAVDGNSTILPINTGVMDSTGHRILVAQVPDDPQLLGLCVTFRAFSIDSEGLIIESNREFVAF